MKSWQAFLMTLGLMVGSAVLPTLKDDTAKAALGAGLAVAAQYVTRTNSNSDPAGKKLVEAIDGSFKSEK